MAVSPRSCVMHQIRKIHILLATSNKTTLHGSIQLHFGGGPNTATPLVRGKFLIFRRKEGNNRDKHPNNFAKDGGSPPVQHQLAHFPPEEKTREHAVDNILVQHRATRTQSETARKKEPLGLGRKPAFFLTTRMKAHVPKIRSQNRSYGTTRTSDGRRQSPRTLMAPSAPRPPRRSSNDNARDFAALQTRIDDHLCVHACWARLRRIGGSPLALALTRTNWADSSDHALHFSAQDNQSGAAIAPMEHRECGLFPTPCQGCTVHVGASRVWGAERDQSRVHGELGTMEERQPVKHDFDRLSNGFGTARSVSWTLTFAVTRLPASLHTRAAADSTLEPNTPGRNGWKKWRKSEANRSTRNGCGSKRA